MGRILVTKLDGSCYMCRNCHTHLADIDELMSKDFHCKHGKAYLFNTVVNVTVGKNEERVMTTGLHVVADIYCICCQQNVGWKYESAFDESQKYKEGKFILERCSILYLNGFSPVNKIAFADSIVTLGISGGKLISACIICTGSELMENGKKFIPSIVIQMKSDSRPLVTCIYYFSLQSRSLNKIEWT